MLRLDTAYQSPPRRRPLGAALCLVVALSACTLGAPPPDVPPELALPAPEPAAAAMAATPFAGFVRGAVLSGPGTAASVARVARAGAEAEGALRAYRPDLSLSLNAAAESLASGNVYGLVPTATLAQVLFDGGARRLAGHAAQARLQAARAEQAAALTGLALDVVAALAELELARSRAALAGRDRAAHAALLDGIARRAEAGAGTEGEVLTARGRLAAAEAAEIAAQGAVRSARARLEELAGAGRPVPPSPPMAPRLRPVALAGAATPDLARRQAELDAAKAELEAAQARRLPVAGLSASASRPADGDGAEAAAGLALDYDIDTKGRRRADLAAAAARLDEARAALETARRAAIRAERQAADAIVTARDRAAAAERAAEAERAAFAATEAEVDRGRRPATALLDAQRDLTRAELTLAEARNAELLAGWRALAIDGRLLSALGLPLPGAAPVLGAGP